MTEVLFYHLEHRPLDVVLPTLLEKCRERGWRVVVQCGSEERVRSLDALLWTYREDSFLPHGTAADGDAALQPVFLAADTDNPNEADVRFLVDRAQPGDLSVYTRAVFMFDGRDEEAVEEARSQWKECVGAGFDVTYWQQDERGRWTRKA